MTPRRKRLWLLGLLLQAGALSCRLLAQSQPYQLYGPDRGLTSLSIQCMAQDSNNVLWVGTANGLFRFDGERFQRFTTEQGLPHNSVRCITTFGETLWAGTVGGAAVWDGLRFVGPNRPGNPFAGVEVRCMAVAGNRLLVGTRAGLAEVAEGSQSLRSWEIRGLGKEKSPVFAMQQAEDGTLWYATINAVRRMNLSTEEISEIQCEATDPPIAPLSGLAITSDGSVWIRGQAQVLRLKPGSDRFVFEMSLARRTDYSAGLFANPDGSLAIPAALGVLSWDRGKLTQLTEDNGLPGGYGTCVLWDHEGNLWIGLRSAGLARRLGRGRWSSWTPSRGLPHGTIHSITGDVQGRLWAGTMLGLVRIGSSDRIDRVFGASAGLPVDDPRAMAADSRGYLWIGYRESGVYRFSLSGGRATPIGEAYGLNSKRIVGLHIDPAGRIWVCSREGLYTASTQAAAPRFELFRLPEVIRRTTIYDIAFDSGGSLWIAGQQGLASNAGGEWRLYRLPEPPKEPIERKTDARPPYSIIRQAGGLRENSIVFLEAGRNGEIWIGYGDKSGVARITPGRDSLSLEHYTEQNGLSSGDLNFLHFDRRGWLWVGNDRGVDLFDSNGWRNFDSANGLVWPDTTWNAFHMDQDGSAWIGTNRGLSRFRPGEAMEPNPPPGVWLNAVRLGDRGVAAEGTSVPWAERSLAIRFAPATFRDAARALSRLRVQGGHPSWIQTRDHFYTFADLPSGDHRLEIQSSVDGVQWTDPPVSFSFTVLAPWWQSWWTWLAGLGAISLVSYGGIRWRTRRLEAQQTALEKMVEARSRTIVEQQQDLQQERRTAERARRRADEFDRRFRSLLETVRLATLMLDREGRVTFCNDYLLELTGWRREEVVGQVWHDRFVPPGEREASRRIFAGALNGAPETAFHESSVLTREESQRLIQWNNAVLRDSDGVLAGIASVGYDLTNHRAVEEEYRQAQRLDSIGRLAGGVAHDFNNLLTVINGYAELLLQQMVKPGPALEAVEQIRMAGERAAALTRQLLAFSRRQIVEPSPLDLNRVVAEAETMIRRIVGEDIRISTSLDASPILAFADAGQVQQVLLNLVVNARDAMPQGGRLTIETAGVEVDASTHDDHPGVPHGFYAQLTVSDTGGGMDAETKERIFEPFFTTKGKGTGTGLGLATVYGIVRQSKGWIRVDSEPGIGTTFRIYLPRTQACILPTPTAATGEKTAPCQGSETVLVVEDEEVVRRLMQSTLESRGYGVLAASSGEEGLRVASESHQAIDLILTDVIMPGMSGREMVEKMRRRNPRARALFVSGYPENAIADQGVLNPGVFYLAKPFTPDALASKVREVLDLPR